MIRKHYFFLFVLLFSVSAIAQLKASIADSKTKEPIPYVNIWAEGKNIEFNADENGSFTLIGSDSKTLQLSAVGYTTTTINISDIKDIILLNPKSIELGEVTIGSKKGKNTLTVNPIKKAKNTWMGAGGGVSGPLMAARYFPYNPEYEATPYIGKIKFEIKADKEYTFNVRLHTANPDGSPGDYLYNDNIIVHVKKRQKNADVDFSKVTLRVPEEGFFVVMEIIAIKENRLGDAKDNPKFAPNLYAYGPLFLCEKSDGNEGWYYTNGKWTQGKKLEKGYAKIAPEVILTD
jgi:hypothetical protein